MGESGLRQLSRQQQMELLRVMKQSKLIRTHLHVPQTRDHLARKMASVSQPPEPEFLFTRSDSDGIFDYVIDLISKEPDERSESTSGALNCFLEALRESEQDLVRDHIKVGVPERSIRKLVNNQLALCIHSIEIKEQPNLFLNLREKLEDLVQFGVAIDDLGGEGDHKSLEKFLERLMRNDNDECIPAFIRILGELRYDELYSSLTQTLEILRISEDSESGIFSNRQSTRHSGVVGDQAGDMETPSTSLMDISEENHDQGTPIDTSDEDFDLISSMLDDEALFPSDDVDGSSVLQMLETLSISDLNKKNEEEELVEDVHLKELTLRPYQKELTKHVCSPEKPNCLVVCETNSGKTLVAVHAIKSLLASDPKSKAVFLTHKVSLCIQQYRLMCTYIDKQLVTIHHGQMNGGLLDTNKQKESLSKKRVFLFTHQTFVNSYTRNSISITDFDLIVFDECHHAELKDPYNIIMLDYFEAIKPSGIRKPQILGLTASPTTFEQKIQTQSEANQCHKQLLYNLDISKISTVEEYEEDLRRTCSLPEEIPLLVDFRPSEDPAGFAGILRSLIGLHAKLLFGASQKCGKELESLDINWKEKLNCKHDVSTQGFDNWARELGKMNTGHKVFQLFLSESSRIFVFLREIVVLCDSVDFGTLLDEVEQYYDYYSEISSDESTASIEVKKIFKMFYQLYEKLQPKLMSQVTLSHDRKSHLIMNKLHEILKTNLMSEKCLDGDRGVVFVTTQRLAILTQKWAASLPDLKNLNPKFITGGLTNQKEILDSFRTGECRLLFATSVIEEGIDIPECKLVVNYNNRINHIQQLQQRGRARLRGSRYYLLSSIPHIHQNSEENRLRQVLTDRAVHEMKRELDLNYQAYDHDKRHSQNEASMKHYMEKQTSTIRPRYADHKFDFTCKKCLKLHFTSEEVKCYKGTLRIVLSTAFKNSVKLKPKVKKDTFMGLTIDKNLLCERCDSILGALIKGTKFEYYNPAVEAFQIQHSRDCPFCLAKSDFDGTINSTTYNKWKKVPFLQPEVSVDDIKKHLRLLLMKPSTGAENEFSFAAVLSDPDSKSIFRD